MKIILLALCSLITTNIMSQQTHKSPTPLPSHQSMTDKPADRLPQLRNNILYQYGIADSFVGGLFEATLPLSELKKHGDFGIGAPGLLDGELFIYDGHAYQTLATGVTREVPDTFKTALAFVTFFKADTIVQISSAENQKDALAQIEKYVNQKNGAYAIKISGNFSYLKTRAFPAYTQKPYPPLATLLDRQKFFDIKNTSGMIIGYKLPPYLNGLSVEGYHFHFLSEHKDEGGHVLDFAGSALTVEIAKIQNFMLSIPQDDEFMKYNFKSTIHSDLEKVEKGH